MTLLAKRDESNNIVTHMYTITLLTLKSLEYSQIFFHSN